MFFVLFFYVLLRSSSAVIYELSESDYARMPPLVHLDHYAQCQQDPDALYCFSEYALVSDQHSPLLDMIKEYSEHKNAHYNHTRIRYGTCVKQSCQKFYNETNPDLQWTLEACLNESISEKYNLKVKLADTLSCRNPNKPAKGIDDTDVIVGAICALILMANLVGSLCDYYSEGKLENKALKYLLCFSIQRNWKKLSATSSEGRDPRLARLKGIHGLRVFFISLVILAHSLVGVLLLTENPDFLENVYKNVFYMIFVNGTPLMQAFLTITAFLLIYNSLIYTEKHKMSWYMLPKAIFIRFIRITPSYALILALTATWFGHAASGPLWDKYLATEMYDCRQHWWRHILFINNYYTGSECMQQAWYLATDTQLYIVALIVFLSCKTVRSQKIVLSVLFVIGILFIAGHIYFQDLDAALLVSPEAILNLFGKEPFFNIIHKSGHPNLVGYVIGMAMGYLVYRWQKEGVDVKKYQKWQYYILYWSTLPLLVLCCSSGVIFYEDAERPSVYFRVLYSSLIKPFFGIMTAVIITGSIFQFEGVYRKFLEANIWVIPSRLTYSAYLLHVAVIRGNLARQTGLVHTGSYSAMTAGVFAIVTSFVGALFYYILVEAPVGNFMKECFLPQEKELKGKRLEESTVLGKEEKKVK